MNNQFLKALQIILAGVEVYFRHTMQIEKLDIMLNQKIKRAILVIILVVLSVTSIWGLLLALCFALLVSYLHLTLIQTICLTILINLVVLVVLSFYARFLKKDLKYLRTKSQKIFFASSYSVLKQLLLSIMSCKK